MYLTTYGQKRRIAMLDFDEINRKDPPCPRKSPFTQIGDKNANSKVNKNLIRIKINDKGKQNLSTFELNPFMMKNSIWEILR